MTEWRYISAFTEQLVRCGVHLGESVVVLSETTSRQILVDTARLAAQSLGAKVVDVVVPTPASSHAVPIRSTGASQAIAGSAAVLAALTHCDIVVDCTVEGLLHAPELSAILGSGTRVLMVSNEHPDVFDRLRYDPDLAGCVERAHHLLASANTMRVRSTAGTDLTVVLAGAFTAGSTGLTNGPGTIAHWPGGLVLAFPAANTVSGAIVLAAGDVNLTFNRVIESDVALTIVDDFITAIDGDGADARLFRSYLSAFDDQQCYATSHVGWGMNRAARWDTVELFDRRETWGTEARASAGNFLYSCGANEVAGRFTAGHFDLPMQGCTVELDGHVVVDTGTLVDSLA